ncbi:MAG: hypothetical protein ACOYI4_09075, partial [Christensenellales bacterium]
LSVSTYGPMTLRTQNQALLQAITLNIEELKAVERGEPINLIIEGTVMNRVPSGEVFFVDAALQKNNLRSTGYMLDIKFYKQVGDGPKVSVEALYGGHEVKLDIPIPAEYREAGRSYYMLNIHYGGAYILKDQDVLNGAKVVINSGRFSTYVLTYAWLPTDPGGKTPNPTDPDDGIIAPPGPVVDNDKGLDLTTTTVSHGRTGTEEGNGEGEDISAVTGMDGEEEAALLTPEDLLEDSATIEIQPEADQGDADSQKAIADGDGHEEGQKGSAGDNLHIILWITGIIVVVVAVGAVLYNKMRRKKT